MRWRPASTLVLLVACASGPSPTPKRWEPEFPPELRETCSKAPAECRQAAEKLAAAWISDEEAFGALKAFSAACAGGDAAACAAVDTRFARPRYLGDPPYPRYTQEALQKRVEGTWAATCSLSRTGQATGCTIELSLPVLDRHFLEWIRVGPWAPATLDGRPFACDYRFEFRLWISG